jgi:hypothetical protein
MPPLLSRRKEDFCVSTVFFPCFQRGARNFNTPVQNFLLAIAILLCDYQFRCLGRPGTSKAHSVSCDGLVGGAKSLMIMLWRLNMSNPVPFILFLAGCIGFGILWEIYRRRCPQCKKFFAREILRSSASRDNYTRYDRTSKTTATDCKCKFCGHTWTQKYTSYKSHK